MGLYHGFNSNKNNDKMNIMQINRVIRRIVKIQYI